MRNIGKTIQDSGGKVLSSAGSAGLGYLGAGLLYDLIAGDDNSIETSRRRRALQLMSAIAAGTLGWRYADKIRKTV